MLLVLGIRIRDADFSQEQFLCVVVLPDINVFPDYQ